MNEDLYFLWIEWLLLIFNTKKEEFSFFCFQHAQSTAISEQTVASVESCVHFNLYDKIDEHMLN